ncbi:MAG: PIN domain nuclease [Dehalococcoidia bacterium]|nr:PIN domain nuclease [Dehalococcoidia bacterium]
MTKLKIYLDTSVISHLDAPDAPDMMGDTLKFWRRLEEGIYDIVLSDVVLDELEACDEPKRSYLFEYLDSIGYDLAKAGSAAVALASKFIDLDILKEKNFGDCRHIAAALISGCDIIVSWNFKHIVNIKTIQGTRKIAATGGYKDIIICTPSTLIDGGINDE